MKHLFVICLCLFLSSSLNAQNLWKSGINGEGPKVTREIHVAGFSGIKNSFACHVILTQGSTYKVMATGQANILDNIIFDEGEHVLTIRYDRPVKKADRVEIEITLPQIDLLSLSGAGSIECANHFAEVEDLEVRVSGSGRISLDVNAEDISNRISGSGSIRIEGVAEHLEGQISGSGQLKALDLQAVSGKFMISGSGNAFVNVSEYIEANISGSGNVRYKGGDQVKVQSRVSGSGSLHQVK
ncbi:MAG: DUF2807 domain-containing protein [Saprospiraceae bacterium]|nr:DUF2807 domain-containing protein [Saprospiraceae bacterium]